MFIRLLGSPSLGIILGRRCGWFLIMLFMRGIDNNPLYPQLAQPIDALTVEEKAVVEEWVKYPRNT